MNSPIAHYVVHLSTPKNWRGGEQQIAYLTTELDKKMIKQTILTPQNSSLFNFITKYREKNTTSNLEVDILKGNSKFGQARFLANFCKNNKVDIVHLHDAHAHTIAVLSAVFFQNKSKFILSRRVDFPVKNNFFSKYKYNHSSIKKIVCVSDKIKEITAPSIKDKSKLITVHSGIDLTKFENIDKKTSILKQEYNLEQDTVLIGNVAALAPHKDYITFLETVKLLIPRLEKNNKKVCFFLIGKEDGSENEIQDWLHQNQEIKDYFVLTGFRNDIPIILKELDIFLFTSQTEGLGTSILDAFASKVPVVATAAGGIPESVIDNQTGLLSKIKDSVSLAENVEKVLFDEELRNKLVTNASLHLQNFTKENTAKKTLEIYKI
ncbi:glycosyltransferase [Bernardetia litoralis DSM 6794]|uniref:Glycosyltransferase n=1 Tax=Bernardetia litoralis (strain ATCC 23117 / DSM 6794 / NBRC 15988 / NCIMB 1366 / Fx l1 / Sio-4) TaxID=880071 RepID=I4AJ63_BERLS|nr:glycosyltransferase family 4 protein [Bernardetia litoralis]AFM03998.1 glycosyltransferase [Bernardetia litoralis DSM 6794]